MYFLLKQSQHSMITRGRMKSYILLIEKHYFYFPMKLTPINEIIIIANCPNLYGACIKGLKKKNGFMV